MDREIQPLEYRTTPSVERVRPRRWLSHMLTAAFLCVVALFVDGQLRYDSIDARRVTQVEMSVAIYGTVCAIVSVARGVLTRGEKAAVMACLLVFAFTAYVALWMPRVIHN